MVQVLEGANSDENFSSDDERERQRASSSRRPSGSLLEGGASIRSSSCPKDVLPGSRRQSAVVVPGTATPDPVTPSSTMASGANIPAMNIPRFPSNGSLDNHSSLISPTAANNRQLQSTPQSEAISSLAALADDAVVSVVTKYGEEGFQKLQVPFMQDIYFCSFSYLFERFSSFFEFC